MMWLPVWITFKTLPAARDDAGRKVTAIPASRAAGKSAVLRWFPFIRFSLLEPSAPQVRKNSYTAVDIQSSFDGFLNHFRNAVLGAMSLAH